MARFNEVIWRDFSGYEKDESGGGDRPHRNQRLKRSAQVQSNYNITAIQELFSCIAVALVRTAAIQQNFCVMLFVVVL